MTCGVAVSASNYGTPLFNLLQSRSNYRSSRESLGVAFRERARTFSRITIHVSAHLRDQLSLSSTVSTNALDLVSFSFCESFQRENCKSLVNSVFPVSSSRRVHKRFEGVFGRIKNPIRREKDNDKKDTFTNRSVG